MAKEERKSITKELDVCHDCAEYGGHFCDECLDEIKKFKSAQELSGFEYYNEEREQLKTLQASLNDQDKEN